MYFNELNLPPSLLRGIIERGYTEMTAVQEQTLSQTLLGKDAAVQSQTGTGKTAAFLVTIFARMLRPEAPERKKALIIVPTRELAVQIEGEARLFSRHLDFTVGCFFGGVGYPAQMNLLKNGVDIVIGTPGRLLDLVERDRLHLKDMGWLVIDEADRLFDMGFLPDIKRLLAGLVPRSARQSMLFSATLSRVSRRIATEYLNQPAFIEITPERLTVDTITQKLYHVKSHIKANLLLGILHQKKPRNALIFTNMRHSAARLAKKLELNGFRAGHLSGDLPQNQRLRIINDFTAGKFSFLVATDVAARGLHIDELEMVINYDLPQDIENYVHRIGRTARAGNSGQAISFACEKFGKHLDDIESFIGMKIPTEPAAASLFATDNGLEHEMNARAHRRPQNSWSPKRNSGRKQWADRRGERKPQVSPAGLWS
jgi:ATP-dependent RNA helicase RhlB